MSGDICNLKCLICSFGEQKFVYYFENLYRYTSFELESVLESCCSDSLQRNIHNFIFLHQFGRGQNGDTSKHIQNLHVQFTVQNYMTFVEAFLFLH